MILLYFLVGFLAMELVSSFIHWYKGDDFYNVEERWTKPWQEIKKLYHEHPYTVLCTLTILALFQSFIGRLILAPFM